MRPGPPCTKSRSTPRSAPAACLGTRTRVSRPAGRAAQGKREIRVASLFKGRLAISWMSSSSTNWPTCGSADHKAFYQLCHHMLPEYAQWEFDMRVYLLSTRPEPSVRGTARRGGSQLPDEGCRGIGPGTQTPGRGMMPGARVPGPASEGQDVGWPCGTKPVTDHREIPREPLTIKPTSSRCWASADLRPSFGRSSWGGQTTT